MSVRVMLYRVCLGVACGAAFACSRKDADPVSVEPKACCAERASGLVAAGPRVYVSNEDSGDVSILDVAHDRELARIPVGKRPRGLRLSADERTLYVAVSGSPKAPPGVDERTLPPPDRATDGIAVVDLASERVVRKLACGSDPESFDLSPDGAQIYVSNEDRGEASLLDVNTGARLATVQVGGEPEGVRARPDGAVVYVTSEAENQVAVIDARTRRVIARVPTGPRPRTVLFMPDGSTAFVSSELGAALYVIDAQRHQARGAIDIALAGERARPMGLALSPDAKTLFVSTGRGKAVAVVDVASRRMTRAIADVGARPWGLAITADGQKLYSANGASNDVSVIDVATSQVRARVPVGSSPWGLVYARQGPARPLAARAP